MIDPIFAALRRHLNEHGCRNDDGAGGMCPEVARIYAERMRQMLKEPRPSGGPSAPRTPPDGGDNEGGTRA